MCAKKERMPNPTSQPPVPVTMVVARRVKPGCEGRFDEWLRGITQEMQKFAGFRGLQLLPPVPDVQPEHVLLLQFDSPKHRDQWYGSDVRRLWLQRAESFTERLVAVHTISGLDGLFQLPHSQPAPPKYKSVVAVTLGLYPLIVANQLWITPHLEFLPLLPRVFATTIVNVTLMAYVMMPLVTRLLRSWLVTPAS